MKTYLLLMLLLLCVAVFAGSCARCPCSEYDYAAGPSGGLPNPFFTMDAMLRAAKELTWPERVDMAARQGYAGLSTSNMDHIDEILDAVDRNHVRLFGFYFHVWIDADTVCWDPRVNEIIRRFKGRDVVLWPTIRSKLLKSSDPTGDTRAVELIRQLSDLAEASNLRVAIYPHTWFWVETTDDALRIAKKVNRDNVGVTFNLCHWLRVEKQRDPRALLERARPYLMMVSINGADYKGTDWDRLIQNLDQGDFDNTSLLCDLRDIGYTGPIGFQNYSIKGDVEENLGHSMIGWRDINEELQTKCGSTP